jgi:hypothetical protein
MGRGKGASVRDVLFGYAGNADGRFPALFTRAWADLTYSFDRLVGAWSIEKVFEWVGDQGIADCNREERESDPSFCPILASDEKVKSQ